MNYSFFDKDISKLFKHIHISNSCEIYCNNVRSIIYQILPINIIDVNEEYKEKIYNSYYRFIKAMPDNVQIISIKDTIDFSKAIQKVRCRLNVVNSEALKVAIRKYIEKLEEIAKLNTQTVLKFYIVLPADIQDYQINIMFENLLNNGMQIKKITDIQEIRKVMRKCIKKLKI